MKQLLHNRLRILFATFSPYKGQSRESTNGNVEPVTTFFVPKVASFTLLDQPHTGSTIVEPIVERYKGGMRTEKRTLNFWYLRPFYAILQTLNLTDNDTHLLFKVRDLLSVVLVGLQGKFHYDYFIGFESINTIAGLWLKKFGRVKRVIYYVSDYSPHRYSNPWFNRLYVWLDRYCCYHADFIWDVSQAMQPARVQAGLRPEKSTPVIHVPNALSKEYIRHLPLNKRITHSLVFMGTLGYENGPDLAIEALPIILKRFGDAHLHIIGKGEKDLERLKKLAAKLRVDKSITFHGFIPDNTEMFALLRTFAIGLAPYRQLRDSVRWYGDSLKLRAYMAAGLPVITTPVPPLGRELASWGSAIVTRDLAEDLASAIISMVAHDTVYARYCQRAIEYGEANTWEKSFSRAFAQMRGMKRR